MFFGGAGLLAAAAVNSRGSAFEVGAVRSIHCGGTLRVDGARNVYDLSADGRRILASVVGEENATAAPMIVVANWTAAVNGGSH